MIGCNINRIGNLPVDHRRAACNNYEYNGNTFGLICFNYQDKALGIDVNERYRGCYK